MTGNVARLVLSFFAVAILVLLIHILSTKPMPDGNENVLMVLVGIAASQTNAVFTYFFGSSEGSRRKTDMLHKIEAKQATGKAGDPVHVAPETEE